MRKLFYLIALSGLIFASCAKPENNHNKEQKYSISIQAAKEANNNSPATRIELINDELHWSVGDKVGLFAGKYQNGQYGELLLNNLPLAGENIQPVKDAVFSGEISYEQIGRFNFREKYTYTSYYPYDRQVSFTHVDGFVADVFYLQMPYVMELTPNVFPQQYAFMWARNTNVDAITHLMNGEQQHMSNVSFYYSHALSYMRLNIGKNPEGKRIVRINIESYGNNISGPYQLSVRYNSVYAYGIEQIDRTRQIDIPQGLYEYNDIYIPMLPNHYGSDMRFEFIYNDETSISKTIHNYPFELERGKIHSVTFNLGYVTTTTDLYGDTLDDFEDGYDLGSF